MSAYCDSAPGHPWHGPYHDGEYGFPASAESVLFERLSLEIFQAGLSWLIVLKKRQALQAAFAGFAVDAVVDFGPADRDRLLADVGIIRNRRKIDAIIENARLIRELRDSHGGFSGWLETAHPRAEADWVKLFRKTFRFTGPEVVREFLLSLGYLPGAHRPECPVFTRIQALNPPWLAALRQVDATETVEKSGQGLTDL